MPDSGTSATRKICQAVTKASRSNFAYAFLFLPRPQREALVAVYAFCRVTDDLVDELQASPHAMDRPAPPDARGHGPDGAATMERLKAWRAELDACFRGEASHPVTRRLAEVIRTYGIPRVYFEELLRGVEMDLVKGRYATFAELEEYCYRVAGVVGLICIEIFGYTRPETRTYAEHLGTAFQLTNILRDLKSDAERGRIYLPEEDLDRFGYGQKDLLQGRVTPAFLDLMGFEVARARQFYAAARAALPVEDRRSMLAAEVMRTIYSRILDRIAAAPAEVLSRRIRLSDIHRLWLALGCWARHRLLPA